MTELSEPGAAPLQNRRKEQFCRFYAGPCWGDPVAAVRAAEFESMTAQEALLFTENLFDESEIRDRIRYLRKQRSQRGIADETWIREMLTEIARNALKDSDRIRALMCLARVVAGGKTSPRRKADPRDVFEQLPLPAFEGRMDGEV